MTSHESPLPVSVFDSAETIVKFLYTEGSSERHRMHGFHLCQQDPEAAPPHMTPTGYAGRTIVKNLSRDHTVVAIHNRVNTDSLTLTGLVMLLAIIPATGFWVMCCSSWWEPSDAVRQAPVQTAIRARHWPPHRRQPHGTRIRRPPQLTVPPVDGPLDTATAARIRVMAETDVTDHFEPERPTGIRIDLVVGEPDGTTPDTNAPVLSSYTPAQLEALVGDIVWEVHRLAGWDTAAVGDDPRAERRRRMAEPDLTFAALCDRTGTPWRSTYQAVPLFSAPLLPGPQ